MNGLPLTRVVGAFVVLILSIGTYNFLAYDSRKPAKSPVERLNTGGLHWDDELVASLLRESEDLWDQAEEALSQHDHQTAYRYVRRARFVLAEYADRHGGQLIAPNLRLRDWISRKEDSFWTTLEREYYWLLSELKMGTVGGEDIHFFVKSFSETGFSEVKDRYKRAQPEIARERMRKAKNWFRVSFRGDENLATNPVAQSLYRHYTRLLHEVFYDKWNPGMGYQLVFGSALDESEAKATWKSLIVTINQEFDNYQVPDESGQARNFVGLPQEVSIDFRVSENQQFNREPLPTSWDTLSALSVEAGTVQEIGYAVHGDTDPAEISAQKIEREYTAKAFEDLFDSLAEEASDLPAFKLFPGVDSKRIRLARKGKLDRAGARILSLVDRESLNREINSLLNTTSVELATDLVTLIISLNLEDFEPWVSKAITRFDLKRQEQILRELQLNPSFGGYKPLLAVVRNAGTYMPEGVARALKGRLGEREVRRTVLELIANRNYKHRPFLAGFFVSEAPWYEVAERAPIWLADKDDQFSVAVFEMMTDRDHGEASKLVLPLFREVSMMTKAAMLTKFEYSPERHGAEGATLLMEAALQKENVELRDQAYATLIDVSWTPIGWDALENLASRESDSRRKADIRQMLLANVRRAHPERATSYMLERLEAAHSAQWEYLVRELLSSDHEKEPVLRKMLALIGTGSQLNRRLLVIVLRNINQYHRSGKNWSHGEEAVALNKILRFADELAMPRERELSYHIMGNALRDGHRYYKAMIEEVLETERNRKARKLLESYLKPS